ncbi:MAG: hypothetical protein ACK4RK_08380 [Gemmataceae bacterium]
MSSAASRDYALLGWVAYAMIALVLAQRAPGLPLWLLCLVVGGAALLFHWQLGSLFFLTTIFAVYLDPLFARRYYDWRSASPTLFDLILTGAVLVYMIAHYRLIGLTRQMLPRPPYLASTDGTTARATRQTAMYRSRREITRSEMMQTVLLLPILLVLAQLVWIVLPDRDSTFHMSPSVWRVLLLAWVVAVGGLVIVTLMRQLRWRQQTAAQAALYLQDILWQETRGEQRVLTRWLAWRRVKLWRKEQA